MIYDLIKISYNVYNMNTINKKYSKYIAEGLKQPFSHFVKKKNNHFHRKK